MIRSRKYRADYDNNPPNTVSVMVHRETDLFYEASGVPPTDRCSSTSGASLSLNRSKTGLA
jgi:hypothetical protein